MYFGLGKLAWIFLCIAIHLSLSRSLNQHRECMIQKFTSLSHGYWLHTFVHIVVDHFVSRLLNQYMEYLQHFTPLCHTRIIMYTDLPLHLIATEYILWRNTFNDLPLCLMVTEYAHDRLVTTIWYIIYILYISWLLLQYTEH